MTIVAATIGYLGDCQGKPIFYGRQHERDNLPLVRRSVRVEDVRPLQGGISLDREGFALVAHQTGVSNFFDPAEQRDVYLPELEALLRQVTGAAKVIVSAGGVLRRSERSPAFGQGRTTVPARFAHCDYSPTPAGSSFWVDRLLPPDEAKQRLGRRYAIYNLWRALSPPPQDAPLAVCDARTVAPADVVCSDCVIDPPSGPEFRFENSVFRYNGQHRWCYFSNMTRDEVLIFKGYDSDPARATGVPHSAFDDPTCPPDAPAHRCPCLRFFRLKGRTWRPTP